MHLPDFEELEADVRGARPVAVEHTLYTEIVGAAWQLGRVRQMETEACAGRSTYTEILDDEVLQKKLDRLARHHTRLERTFHRCLKELKTLQAQRRKEETLPSPERTTADLDAQLRRLNESALSAISQRTQSAPLAETLDPSATLAVPPYNRPTAQKLSSVRPT